MTAPVVSPNSPRFSGAIEEIRLFPVNMRRARRRRKAAPDLRDRRMKRETVVATGSCRVSEYA
jgi:hypothetical protein